MKRPDDFDASDEAALREEFGPCICDGAYDPVGCPICTEEQFILWWIRRQAEKKTRFDRPDVV